MGFREQDFSQLRDDERLVAIRAEIAHIRETNRLYQAIPRPSEAERFAYSSRKLRLEQLKAELAKMKGNSESEPWRHAG
jgi:hypothetical protein